MAQGSGTPTVRDATLDAMRRHGLTTIFANPGSTEIAFLAGLPDDFEFVLGLHEAAVVAMATGYAIGRGAWPPRMPRARRRRARPPPESAGSPTPGSRPRGPRDVP